MTTVYRRYSNYNVFGVHVLAFSDNSGLNSLQNDYDQGLLFNVDTCWNLEVQ